MRMTNLMTGRISILKFLLVLIGGTALGGLVLGVFGFLLAGKEGFVNMLYWGLALGFLGGISEGFAMLIGVHYWTGYVERFGKSWFKKMAESENEKQDY
jgi:hypothetical protein